MVAIVILLAINNAFGLGIPERIGVFLDGFKLWAYQKPGEFIAMLGLAIYILFFYKQGQVAGYEWVPFSDVFHGFKNSRDQYERAHYQYVVDNYTIDHGSGGVMAQDATSDNGNYFVFYKKRADAKDKDAKSEMLACYDLKRLPKPAGANRIRMFSEKMSAFAFNNAVDLGGILYHIGGVGDSAYGEKLMKGVEEGKYSEDTLSNYLANQTALARQTGILQR